MIKLYVKFKKPTEEIGPETNIKRLVIRYWENNKEYDALVAAQLIKFHDRHTAFKYLELNTNYNKMEDAETSKYFNINIKPLTKTNKDKYTQITAEVSFDDKAFHNDYKNKYYLAFEVSDIHRIEVEADSLEKAIETGKRILFDKAINELEYEEPAVEFAWECNSELYRKL